jgi:hypothetical protein
MRLRSLPCLVLLCLLASSAGAADSVASFTLPSGHRDRIVEAPFEDSASGLSGSGRRLLSALSSGCHLVPCGSLSLPVIPLLGLPCHWLVLC